MMRESQSRRVAGSRSQGLVIEARLRRERERLDRRTHADKLRQIRIAADRAHAAEIANQIERERAVVARELATKNSKRLGSKPKNFAVVKANRDALRKAEEQSVEGALLAKLFRDDAARFRFEAKMWKRACELKLLEMSGETIGPPDAKFPDHVWELFYSGWPLVTGTIADGTLKEVGRETIFEWCYGNYLCEDDDPRYSRPLLVTQNEYDRVVEAFKTLFERLPPSDTFSNNLAGA
jgi:hypothetical protein